MPNTRIILDRQSDLMLTGATLSSPYITSPIGLVKGDIFGLTTSLNLLDSKDESIDYRLSIEESVRNSIDFSINTRLNNFSNGLYQSIPFTGTIDGVNKNYINTSNDLSSVSFTQIFLNGLLQDVEDCTLTLSSTFSSLNFIKAPDVGSKISVIVFIPPYL